MYSLVLAILLTVSAVTGSTQLIEDFNSRIDGLYQSKTQEKSVQTVDWTKSISPQAVKNDTSTFTTDAKAAYAIDLSNGQVIESKNENSRLMVASLTKLMTAYVILRDQSLEKEMVVPAFSIRPDDSLAGLNQGETLTVRNLLQGMLINSGSDAAQTLAINDSGSNEAFVVKMNSAAQSLNLPDTHFDNPVGWDNRNNYSSAKDMAILARVLLNNKFFAETVAKKNATITTKSGRTINLSNTNLLLNNSDIVGVKTGFTYQAGECLVDLKTDGEHKLLTVIIGSRDRFGQTRAFLDWIKSHFSW